MARRIHAARKTSDTATAKLTYRACNEGRVAGLPKRISCQTPRAGIGTVGALGAGSHVLSCHILGRTRQTAVLQKGFLPTGMVDQLIQFERHLGAALNYLQVVDAETVRRERVEHPGLGIVSI